MGIDRIKPSGWDFAEKLTSPQATQLDINIARALDKTVTGDTLAGRIGTSSGAGIDYGSGASETHNSGSTETHTTGSNDSYQAGSTLDHAIGSVETHSSGASDTYASGSSLTANVGATVILAGTTTATSTINANAAVPVTLPSTSLVRTVQTTPIFDPASWAPASLTNLGPLLGVLWVTLVNTVVVLRQPLQLPHGQRLDTVRAHILGLASASLPATMPCIRIWASPVNVAAASAAVQIGSTTPDTSPTVGAFNLEHVLSITSIAHTIDVINNLYFLEYYSGGGGGTQVGSAYYGAITTVTHTSILE